MAQVLFLTSVGAGVLTLVAAISVARLHWRTDVAPFGRHTNAIKVLARPALYARPSALRAIRTLTIVGCTSFGVALGCLVYQLVADVSRPYPLRLRCDRGLADKWEADVDAEARQRPTP